MNLNGSNWRTLTWFEGELILGHMDINLIGLNLKSILETAYNKGWPKSDAWGNLDSRVEVGSLIQE